MSLFQSVGSTFDITLVDPPPLADPVEGRKILAAIVDIANQAMDQEYARQAPAEARKRA